ncbi:MAG TPA: phenylalanine--tRNA ligase subunit alpha [Candidatus Bathyarchaeia archaeon]|nr:phenylalanine--tRNA ligase subunit alpha [Candidatus Bathyarchaeia archaeon]
MSSQTDTVRDELLTRIQSSDTPHEVLRAPELRTLVDKIKNLPVEERADAGRALNELKQALQTAVDEREAALLDQDVMPIDVTAPFDVNRQLPSLLPTELGTKHPISVELERIIDIFTRMGFDAHESRQLDNDWNMFGALNFPEGHPARDGYDTFRTEEGFIPPAHTSTMQNRVLKSGKEKLESGGQIAGISYGRCYRNEDLDATHEHTFYQVEGVFVSKDATLGQMLGVLRAFYQEYFAQKLNIKTQPAYFPFVEPGLEFMIEKPASLGGKPGDFLEVLGCGMIHPNVLSVAGIDPTKYRGFAWGGGVERIIMLKYGIEDIRHFESGKLAFLRKFA